MTRSLAGWSFAAPAMLVIVVFFFLPVVAALGLSVTDFDIYALADIGNLRFVAFDNYVDLLHDPLFWKTLGNTLYFVVVGVPLSIAVSLGAAVLLHSKLGRFKGFFRSEEHTSELQSLMRISYAVFCLKQKITNNTSFERRREQLLTQDTNSQIV